ncbi:MAG: M56 family metallopeptidase [Candidatus Sulfotelmatobacter sp.]
MTFLVRGIAVSFSIGVIVYGFLSLIVSLGWRVARPDNRRYAANFCADVLFWLRLAPAVISALAMLSLAAPSFLWLEPRSAIEPIGVVPIALSICALAGVLWGIWNAASSLRRALRTVAIWAKAASVISSERSGAGDSVPILQSSSALPPLTAAGILKPSVWLSQTAESMLSQRELGSALRHEMVHVRRKDNLRKLIFRLIAFPGMERLESAWREAAELAADDAAVSNRSEALDLAAALIKLSRIAQLHPPAELTTALVSSPMDSVNARVERLISWSETRPQMASFRPKYVLCTASAIAMTLAFTYTHLLIFLHAATELLVR